MAISSDPINGNLMYLYLSGVAVARCTGITISGSVDMIVVMDEAAGAKELSAAITNQTKYTVKLIQLTSTGTHVHGDYYWHGSCYISGYTVTSAPNDKVTFSATIEGDGALLCTAYT